MQPSEPAQRLEEGSIVLRAALDPHGFSFKLQGGARGSGGEFAYGEFARGNRRIELHYRQSLGQVKYHAGFASASHATYMRELGVWNNCRYPGFSSASLQVFKDLAHDIEFATDFLMGNADVLASAARKENIESNEQSELLMAGSTGQNRQIARMRSLFKEGKYSEVIAIYRTLPLPHLLTDAQLKLVSLARARDA